MTILFQFVEQPRSKPMITRHRITICKQNGFSLIELMIAITLGLMVVGVLTTLFVQTSANRREIDRTAGILENGRYALSVLKSDLGQAGYYGTLSVPIGLDATVSACSDSIANWRKIFAFHVFGSNHTGSSLTDLNNCLTALPARKENTDAILIQRASTCVSGPTAETGCTTKGTSGSVAYLQVSECGDEYVNTPFVLDTGAAETFVLKNRAPSTIQCGAASSAPIRRYYRSLYYVDTANRLIRADQAVGGKFTFADPLAEGIENIQFQYGFDTNNDGTADVFDTVPPTGKTWADAMGVRVWILARAASTTPGYASSKAFAMGDYTVTPSDAFKRHVFSSYINFTNPSGKRFK